MSESGIYENIGDYGDGTIAVGVPVRDPDPSTDYVVTGPGRLTPGIPQLLPQAFDEVTKNFGFRVYESMLTDPAVKSSYLALKLAIISGPLKVMPVVRPKGYREGAKLSPRGGATVTPQEARAVEVAEFCAREIKRPKESFKSTLMQGLDMMAFGNKLGEVVREECKFGPDKGKLGFSALKIKPHWAWSFVVDSTMKPVGVLTYLPPGEGGEPGGYVIVDMSKFCRFTWLATDNDPRGTSALRAAYDWWNLKRQSMPFYYQHLRRFGSPSLDAEMSPGDNSQWPPIDPITGVENKAGKPVSSATRFTQALLAFQNNSVIVRPAGSKLTALEPRSNGEAFLSAFDLFDRQICLSIGLQTRSNMEAKHGSKADSDTAENTRGLVIAYGREELGDIITRQLLYESVRLNFGDDVAEEFTPSLVVGTTEEQDKPAMITALTSAGFAIGQSQLVELDTMLDLPERDEEADAQHAQEQAQLAADMASQVAQSKGGPPDAGGQGAKKAPAKEPVKGSK